MDRRHFITGMAGILAAGVAPSIILTPGLLMPVRRSLPEYLVFHTQWITIDQLRLMYLGFKQEADLICGIEKFAVQDVRVPLLKGRHFGRS